MKENIYELILERLTNWAETFIKHLPNIGLAIVILLLTVLALKVVRKAVRVPLEKVSPNKAVYGLFRKVISLIVLLSGFFLALEVLNLEKTVTSLLAGAGVIGIALGFAFQEIASNFVSGIFIAFDGPYKIGDIVQLGDSIGEIKEINMRTTTLRTFQGLEVIIPNKELFTKTFINYTLTPYRRIDLSVGVSYNSNLTLVEKVTKQALQGVSQRVIENDIEFYYKEFGDSSINFEVRVWVNYPANQAFLKARSEMVKFIKEAFDEKGINIPFPIRTLDIPKGALEIKNGG